MTNVFSLGLVYNMTEIAALTDVSLVTYLLHESCMIVFLTFLGPLIYTEYITKTVVCDFYILIKDLMFTNKMLNQYSQVALTKQPNLLLIINRKLFPNLSILNNL